MSPGVSAVPVLARDIPHAVWVAVDAAIASLPPEGGIVSLSAVLDRLGIETGADPAAPRMKRFVTRAMHLRGATTFTRARCRCGGSYRVTGEVRATVRAEGMERGVEA